MTSSIQQPAGQPLPPIDASRIVRSLDAPDSPAQGLRIVRITDPTQRQAVVDALTGASILQGSEQKLKASGVNGPPTALLLQLDQGLLLPAVTKAHTGLESADLAAQELGNVFGIGHLLPPADVRDGGLITAMVGGKQAGKLGVITRPDLLAAFERYYEINHPEMPVDARRVRATMELEIAQVLDFISGTLDRHERNVMIDPETGAVWWIDHGSFGDGQRKPGKPPVGDSTYLQNRGLFRAGLDLSEPTLEFLRKNVSADDVHRIVAQHVDNRGMIGATRPEQVAARYQQVLDKGSFEIQRNPLMDLWFKHGGEALDRSPVLQRWIGTARAAQESVAALIRGAR